MGETRQHLKTLEEIERDCIPGLVEVLREEGLEAVRYFLWDLTGWHHTTTTPSCGGTARRRSTSASGGRYG